jgi:hypothetical protein
MHEYHQIKLPLKNKYINKVPGIYYMGINKVPGIYYMGINKVPGIYYMGINKVCVKEDIFQGMYCIRKIYANYRREPQFNRTAVKNS